MTNDQPLTRGEESSTCLQDTIRWRRLLQAAAGITRELLDSPAPGDCLPGMLETLGNVTDAQCIWFIPAPRATREEIAILPRGVGWSSAGTQPAPPHEAPAEPASELPPHWLQRLKSGQFVCSRHTGFDHAENSQGENLWLARHELDGALILPVRSADRLWGGLCFDTGDVPDGRDGSELHILQSVCDQFAGALTRELQATQLRRAKEAAEVAVRAKDRFLAMVSHELRTPLNAILGYTQLRLEITPAGTEEFKDFESIQSAAEHLLDMINDLIDLSKSDVTQLELLETSTDLRRLLSRAVELVRLRANEKRLGLEVSLDPDVPRLIMADAKRLRQVLVNLLANAVKFTSTGSVELRVRRQDDRLLFEVADTGCGIAAEDLQKLFQPFQQLGSTAQKSQGSGLGLAISKRIVQTMGSDLHVESQPGVGSRFSFELHCPASESSSPATDKSDNASCLNNAEPESPPLPEGNRPEPAQLERLRLLASRGDVLGLRAELERWATRDPAPNPLAGTLRDLAAGFRLKAVSNLLDRLRSS